MSYINSFIKSAFCFGTALALFTSCQNYKEQRQGNTSTSGMTTLMCDNSFENIMQQEIDVPLR